MLLKSCMLFLTTILYLILLKFTKSAILLSKVSYYKVLCSRPAKFLDLNEANFNFMDRQLDELETKVEAGEQDWKQKELEYQQKPQASQSSSILQSIKLQPLTAFMDVFNGVSKFASELFWESDNISTNQLQTLNRKATSVFNGDFFKSQLTPKQIKVIESGMGLAGKVANSIASFKAKKRTAKENVYQGLLEVQVTSEEHTYHIYTIKSLVTAAGQVLKEVYLVMKGSLVFTTKDLSMFKNCPLLPITSTANTPLTSTICKSVPEPTLEAKKCGNAILNGQPLTSCDLVCTIQFSYVLFTAPLYFNLFRSTPMSQ